MLPARLRSGAAWNDACILNISSRGLMVHAPHGVDGDVVEVCRGNHVICARVVWREGPRAGLQADERLPVEEIMTLSQSQALQLTAAEVLSRDRRSRRRGFSDSRIHGRAFEFVSVGIIAASLALSTASMVEAALARPFAAISAVLSGALPPP